MKTIIAGSRSITAYDLVKSSIEDSGFRITQVVSGGAYGVDRLGEQWARENNIPVRRYPADWISYGKAAGLIRNRMMALYADQLIAIWDGKSKGTEHMIQQALEHGLSTYIHNTKGDNDG